MNRISRVALAVAALTIPVASIVVVEATSASAGTVVAKDWCC